MNRGGDFLLTVKANQPTLQATLQKLFESQTFSPSDPPQYRGRLEIPFLRCLEVIPSQAGFPGARLAARLETRVKRGGKWTREVVFLLSSLTLEQLQAQGMPQLIRNYGVIEGRLHHCLDIILQEDLSQVRTPNSARVLGMLRRVVLSLSTAAVDEAGQANPKSKFNTKTFRQRFLSARGGREHLQALIFSKTTAVLDIAV